MNPKVNLLFPIEILNRELDFRLMFAGVCVRPEHRIWIGSMKTLYRMVQDNQHGLYVGKHILYNRFPNANQDRYEVLRQNEFAYIHLDEEGAVHPGGEEEWKRIFSYTLDPRFLRAEDHVCTWGDWQRDFYRSYEPAPACCDNIQTTGHPRFDLYKKPYRKYYDAEVASLREKLGEFVLINTNFSFVNRPRESDDAFSARFFYEPENAQNRLNQVRRWTHISKIMANFIRLATRISVEFPKLNVVIRPHPSEDTTIYHKIFDRVPNVHILHEGTVGPWLLASRCLIHDGCTTAIESHFCQTPIINYKPEVEPQYDKFLPNLFGFQAREENEAIGHLGEILNSGAVPEYSAPENQKALALLDNFRHDSFEKLSQVVVHKASTVKPLKYSAPAVRTSLSRAVKSKFTRRKPNANPGRLQEFYGFENVNLAEKMQTVQQILNKDLNWQLHNRDLLTVEMS